MTCTEAHDALIDLTLSGRSSAAVEAHLAGCPACAREAQSLTAVAGLLRSYEVPAPPQGLASIAWRRAAATLPGRPASGWRVVAWPLAAASAALPLVIAYNMILLKALFSLGGVLPFALVYYLAGSYLAAALLALGVSYGAVPILASCAAAAEEVPLHG